jgi:hypothetical protein
MKTWVSDTYVTRNGKQETFSQYAQAKPSKPEYADWLTLKVWLSPDVADGETWKLAASECRLVAAQTKRDYQALIIIDPHYKKGQAFWDLLPDKLLKGEMKFATTFLPPSGITAPGISAIANGYDEIGLENAKTTDEISFHFGFPEDVPRAGVFTLTLRDRK